MRQVKSEVLFNRKVISGCFVMGLYCPEIARSAEPGQFVHLRVEDREEPLLRRPFSIYRVENEKIEILYKVVGRGTKILSRKRRGEKIDLLGPLGKGFKIDSTVKRLILVAGGVGVAPLYFLTSRWAIAKMREVIVFLGAESKERLLCEEEFKGLGTKVKVATENGSRGFKGLISDLFAKWLSSGQLLSESLICACGPLPMLRKIASLSKRSKAVCYVSLEQRMGCGIGACRGCIIRGKNGYLRVCKDGPVFNAQDIDWNWMP
ncbi:dihydroorotate dehydrogenase electron transfer subunit [Candidatus Aerophobetes bacterium]|uniref:Dihydroorotate dehydrogenase B (NAD(+)), electron transfer subunit n=1 Tax=Aerophobetes bacterium TaxID=2030807 RepID=A0A497E5U0_UNCAE|nr:MAG: dihydroorotate dehydrogenase electron transfer subunit [Candidatus Aerophobetes bacterium]